MKPRYIGKTSLLTAAALALLGGHAHALTYTWLGTNATNNDYWSVAGNWDNGVPANATDTDIIYNSNTNVGTMRMFSANPTIRSMTFAAGNSATTRLVLANAINDSSLGRNLTFSAGVGNNATLTVIGAGSKTINRDTSTTASNLGNIILTSTLDVVHNGSGTLTLGNGDQTTNYGVRITGAGGINKSGTGTLVIGGSGNTYSGATNITGGTLQIGSGSNGTLSTSSAISISSNATLGFNRTGTITQGTDFANAISGAGLVNKLAGGTLVLNGTNTYSGGFTWGNAASESAAGIISLAASSTGGPGSITSGPLGTGTFTVRNNNATTASHNIQSNDGTTRTISNAIAFGGTGINFNTAGAGNLIFDGAVNLGGGGRTINVANTGGSTTTFSGVISGTSGNSLTKGGAATLILTGANSYNGLTTVNAGKLVINGNQNLATGAVTVATGATLGGSGTVGGFLATGNSIGTQTFLSGLTINGTDQVELGTAGATPSAGLSDRSVVTGNLTLGAASVLQLIDNAGADGNGSAGAGAYRIATYTGNLTGTFNSVDNPLSSTLHEKVIYGAATGGGSVDLELYRLATTNTISTPVSLGKARVGDTWGTSALSIQNTAAADGFSEGLNATQGATTGAATVSGTNITNLAAGTSSSTIIVSLNAGSTSTSGIKTGTVDIGLASNGSGTSGYGSTALTGQSVTVNGTVYDYAEALFSQTAGAGSLSGSGISYTLDFGSGLALNTNYTATIQLANGLFAASFQDSLGGSYTAGGDSEFSTTAATFNGLASGGTNSFTITFNTGSAGTFNGTLDFAGLSQQSGLMDASLSNINIAFTGTTIPEPTAALLGSLGMLLLLRRRRA